MVGTGLAERKRWTNEVPARSILVMSWSQIQMETARLVVGVPEQTGFGSSGGEAVLRRGDTNQNLLLEMRALVCRLLIALICFGGINYVRSPVNTRQMHAKESIRINFHTL